MRSKAFAVLAVAFALEAGLLSAARAQTAVQPQARCSQLVAYYDRFGTGRSTDSDGRRNQTRISAAIDCSKSLYAEGIQAMEDLLQRKKFTSPPPGPNVPEDDD